MRKQIIYYFATVISLASSIIASAQSEIELTHTAPSLQIGLDGLNFHKGALDAQVIMIMVAEKQKGAKKNWSKYDFE